MTPPPWILAADDDSDYVLLAHLAFEKARINALLTFVADGQEAIDHLSSERRAQRPDVIFLDVKMPKVDGFDVLQWVRKQPALKRLPVIMLSSSERPEDIARAYDLGANSFLVKPPNMDDLVKLLQTLHHYWLELNRSPNHTEW